MHGGSLAVGDSCIPWLAAGVMCLDFHPQHANLLAVGCYDGSVSVFDVRSASNKPMYRQALPLSCTLLASLSLLSISQISLLGHHSSPLQELSNTL